MAKKTNVTWNVNSEVDLPPRRSKWNSFWNGARPSLEKYIAKSRIYDYTEEGQRFLITSTRTDRLRFRVLDDILVKSTTDEPDRRYMFLEFDRTLDEYLLAHYTKGEPLGGRARKLDSTRVWHILGWHKSRIIASRDEE